MGMLHLIGLLLTAAVCVDYGIFFIENKSDSTTRTFQAITVSALTTSVAFACLGAKAGVFGASKSLALELASRNITVNCVAPGVIEGRINRLEFTRDDIKRIVPMQRAGTADEVAALVDFLVSEDAGYISGQSISIDGAMS